MIAFLMSTVDVLWAIWQIILIVIIIRIVSIVIASDVVSIPMLTSLANAIIAEKKLPEDWDLSYIINLYKGKGNALERGNYRGLN